MNESNETASKRSNGQRINYWLSVGASIGALIGLFLVAIQLKQNRDLVKAQIRHELAIGIIELLEVTANNAQLAGVIRRGALGEELTLDEQFQYDMRTNALLRYWEDVHYQYRQGLYDEVEFLTQRKAWKASISKSIGFQIYWCEVRDLYSPLFRDEMDKLLPTDAC